ncbi:hypothetical protein [Prochlorococcus sp. MIT 1201]|uniref:hypothetical protein n=1 Tax=Prochlorococcus sp. MIT 1201 TaxID=3082535 RepID=UPI0039A5FDB4
MALIQRFASECRCVLWEEQVMCCIDTSNTGDPLGSSGQRLTQQRLWSSSIPITWNWSLPLRS